MNQSTKRQSATVFTRGSLVLLCVTLGGCEPQLDPEQAYVKFAREIGTKAMRND